MELINWFKKTFETKGEPSPAKLTAFLFVWLVLYKFIFDDLDDSTLMIFLGFIAAAFGIEKFTK